MNADRHADTQERIIYPMMTPAAICRKVSEVLSAVITAAGLLVLCGWILDIAALKSIAPQFVAMKANTAICFILTGMGLWLAQESRLNSAACRYAARLAAVLVFIIGLLTFVEYVTAHDLGIDQLLFKEHPDALFTSSPGRMAFNTCLLFMVSGIVIFLIPCQRLFYIYLLQILSALLGIAGLISLVGYVYGAEPLIVGVNFSTAMAVHTATLFIGISFSAFFARAESAFMRNVTSSEFGSLVVRKVLPFTIAIPLCLGWLEVWAENLDWVAHGVSEVGVAIATVVLFNSCIIALAYYLNSLDRKRQAAERMSHSAKDFLSKIVDSIADPVFVKDSEHRFILVNQAECELTGVSREEQLGRNDYDFFPKEQVNKFWGKDDLVLETGEENVNEELITSSDGRVRTLITKKTRYIDSDGKPYIVGVIRDITDLKKIEEALRKREADLAEKVSKLNSALLEAENARELMAGMLKENNEIRKKLEASLEELKQAQTMAMQSEKLSSIGRLAGGVAHDFNNQLTVISGYADILLSQMSASDPKYAEVEQIQKAAKRSTDLTRQLLAFSRRQMVSPKVMDLNKLIFEINQMLRRLIGEDIELAVVPEVDLGLVNVDPSQIDHMLTNLTVNARDVMPQGGKLVIATKNVTVSAGDPISVRSAVPAGKYVMISVTDTGTGMSDEIKAHVFEPFFTTKEKGKGTGLGLATVYGIVTQNKGYIQVSSELGKGASFEIYFPRVEGKNEYAGAVSEMENLPKGLETVMLVEDEPGILNFESQVLLKQGYTVLAASNGPDALRMISELRDKKIDLVVTDLIMPQMSGRELSETIHKLHSGIKFLFISGYTDDMSMHHGIFEKTVNFLQKPFSAASLILKVREALDKPS